MEEQGEKGRSEDENLVEGSGQEVEWRSSTRHIAYPVDIVDGKGVADRRLRSRPLARRRAAKLTISAAKSGPTARVPRATQQKIYVAR